MKKYIYTLLFAITLLIVLLLLIPIGEKCATLFTLTSSSEPSLIRFPESYYEGESALKKGWTQEARRIIEEGKAQAKDSNDYYRFEVLDAMYYSYIMQADSFLCCNRRLRNYIERNRGTDDPLLRLLEMECEMQLGIYEAKMTGRMDLAQEHNMKALELANQLRCAADRRQLLLVNIADVYKQQGRYDQSVNFFREAMNLGDSIGMNDAMRITLDIGIASAYAAMHNFEHSAKWWKQAEGLKPRMDSVELFHYLNNRGNDYYLQGKYRESLDCFLELDSIIADDSNLYWERMFERCNLSDIYIKLGYLERGKEILDETQPFFTKQQQFIPLFYLITQRIELALEEGRLDEAKRLVSENPIPEWMIPEQLQLRRKVLMRLYQQTGEWQKYSEQLRDYVQLRDSIASDNMKMRFSEALMHYEHEKAMLEKQRLLEEKELSFYWALALLLISFIVIVLLCVIFAMKQRERQLRESEMRSSIAGLRMENVRNRITPHFISNALAAEIMTQMDGKEANLDSLVQLLHRGIELTDVEQSTLSEELEFIRFYCNIESRSVGDDFRLVIELDDAIDADRVLLPSMSIQILVENAIKHGLRRKPRVEGKLRTVTVKATQKDGATLVEIIDNGQGLPENRRNKERTGLRVMGQTLHLLNEQYMQSASYHSHDLLMDYGLDNYCHPDGDTGCRAWLLLPEKFDYTLKKGENDGTRTN